MELNAAKAGLPQPRPTVLFFALPNEASPFVKAWHQAGRSKLTSIRHAVAEKAWSTPGLEVYITGMGRRNARRTAESVLGATQPLRVITAGFAGGLNPRWKTGEVLIEADAQFQALPSWSPHSTHPGKFHEADSVATTPAAKESLWKRTGADAVEMESGTIRALCRELSLPSATVRVISDAAHEALPIDFSALMTPEDRLDFLKLAGTLVRSPRLVPQLMRLQKQVEFAAGRLAQTLLTALPSI